MLIILSLLAILVACVVIGRRSYSAADLCFPIGLVAVVVLFVAVVFLPFSRMDVRASIAEFEAIRASRAGGSEIEAAAWRMKVAESNAWLASTRYYNRTVFDIWIPDAVEDLEPIE